MKNAFYKSRYTGYDIEDRYTWNNVFRANLPTNRLSLTGFFSRMSLLKNDEILGNFDTNRISQIVREGNPSLEEQTPQNKKKFGSLGYEDNSPYGDDFKYDKREIDVTKTISSAGRLEDKVNIAYLMGEQTRILRPMSVRKSILGYYCSRSPNLNDDLINTALTYFDETEQLEKGVRLAERMKKYNVAAEIALKQNHPYVAAECLYLEGKTKEALQLVIESAKYPMQVYGWLISNSEIELAKRIAPSLISQLEGIRNSSTDRFSSIKYDIERLKEFLG